MESELFPTKIKEEEANRDHHWTPMGSSEAAAPTDGGVQAFGSGIFNIKTVESDCEAEVNPAEVTVGSHEAEENLLQINKKEDELDYDYYLNPMENSTVALTAGDTAQEPLQSPGMLVWPPESRAQTILDCGLSASSAHLPAAPKAAGFICNKCGLSFSLSGELVSHYCGHSMFNRQSQQLQQQKPPMCLEMQKCSNNNSRIYTEEICVPCPQCGRLFPKGYRLRTHILTHNKEKPFMCSECGRAFKRQFSLMEHERLHTGEKPYRCQRCGRSYAHRGSLYSHQIVCYEEKPFACTECGKQFSQKSLYLLHQNSHIPPCADCGKIFTRKYSYLQHIKSHRRRDRQQIELHLLQGNNIDPN